MDTKKDQKILAVISDPILQDLLRNAFFIHFQNKVSFHETAQDVLSIIHEQHEHLHDHIAVILQSPPDMSITDFMDVLDQEALTTPVIVITENKDSNLTLSTQDIFIMPLPLGTLIDRLHKHLHKCAALSNRPVAIGPYMLHPAQSTLTPTTKTKTNDIIHLTEKERDILLKLLSGHTVTRQELLDDIWGYVEGIETHTLETHIYRLRQKIEIDPTAPQWLITNDEGYCLMS